MIRLWKDGMEQKGSELTCERPSNEMQGKAGAGRELWKISMPNRQERYWKKLDMLNKMQEVNSQKV